MATYREALQAKEKLSRTYLKAKGVYGIGVGAAHPERPGSGAAVIFYTGQAVAGSKLAAASAVITSRGKKVTVPVRYVVTKPFRRYGSAKPANLTGKIRPVPAGYSIGTLEASGTVGLIVTGLNGQNRYALSNNHVLNRNNTSGYSGTYQPGGADPDPSRIGRLDRFVQLRKQGVHYVDAAIAVPLQKQLLSPTYAKVGTVPGHVTSYRVGQVLKKVGRTTGLVTGVVQSVHTDVKIDYGDYGNLGTLTYRNQTVIRGTNPVSLPGDSGSVWLRRSDDYAVAVNYAGPPDGKLSIAFPVHWTMQAFKTRVATPAGAGKVKVVKPLNNSYVRPLTPLQLKRIKVIRAKTAP
ncbi:hypothetical protein [Gorillibacterium sp. sgz5001074]|uniref:hypothetical protein n=1 Tax=Gorillibacterium sp. sgz5001074 TaxID=3446695 RepID=UPI003F666252